MEVRACRICLATGVKLHNIHRDPIASCVESVSALLFSETSHVLHYVCYECAAIIVKFSKLVEKNIVAQSVLYDIVVQNHQVTQESLCNINRQTLKLCSNLSRYTTPAKSIIELHHKDDEVLKEIDVKFHPIKSEYETDSDNGNLETEFQVVACDFKIKNETDKMCESREVKKDKETNRKTYKDSSDGFSSDDEKALNLVKRKKKTKRKIKRETRQDGEKGPKKLQLTPLEQRMVKFFDIITLTREQQVQEMSTRRQSDRFARAAHGCHLCYRTFGSLDTYKNHMLEHDPSRGAFSCELCHKRFKERRQLNRHLIYYHEKLYRCKMCPAICKDRMAVIHMSAHDGSDNRLKCPRCDFTTEQPKLLAEHTKSHLRHACACGRAFYSERGLRLHRQRAHARNAENAQSDEFPCKECDMAFASEVSYKVHLLTSVKHQAEENKRRVCKRCGADFGSREELWKHTRDKHPVDKSFPKKCDYCDEMMKDNRTYWNHTLKKHSEQRHNYRSPVQQHLCEVCGKGFTNVTSLRSHSARHATQSLSSRRARQPRLVAPKKEDAIQCAICGRGVRGRNNYNRHVLSHSGAKPYQCSVCNKSFTRASGRDLHVRTIHQKLPAPPRKRRKKGRAALPVPIVTDAVTDS